MRPLLLLLGAATVCMGMPEPQSFAQGLEMLAGSGKTFLGDAIQEFGLDVSVELQRPGNVAISPLSISALLSLLMMGSTSIPNLELRRALHYPDNLPEDTIHRNFQRLMDTISSDDPDLILNVANGLFLQRGAKIVYNFTRKAHVYYNSVVSTEDFQNSTVTATNNINKWVKESTSGMIPNLFTQPLDPMTTFVAVNTVFFNGKWLTPFSADMTSEREFDTGNGKIQIPIMSTTMDVDYINIPDLNAHMAAFPYKGGRQTMYVILPKGPVTSDLDPLEQELSAELLHSYINRMTLLNMRIWLPRMRLAFKTSLRDTLRKLHINAIFDPTKAKFGYLSENRVWVNDVLHETVIEVTEEGTKAAAVTSSDFNRSGTSNAFIVNRPAIIFIRDDPTGVPLFWARLVRPEPLRNNNLPASPSIKNKGMH